MNLNKSRKERAIKLAEDVLTHIDTELSALVDEREGSISDSLLLQMQKLVLDLKLNIDEDRIPEKEHRHKILQRIITDSWPWRTTLGKKVGELENLWFHMPD